LRHNAAAIAT